MRRVLVSGASGIVGYGVLRSLRASGLDVFLVGTSMYNDSIAPAFCDVFEQAPPTNDAAYRDWLLSVISRHSIEMMIPAIEIDMYHWVEHMPAISQHGAVPLLNLPELIALCKDKWAFFQRLRRDGLECTIDSSLERDFELLEAKFGLPFLLKPRRGFGSRGIVRVNGFDVFAEHCPEIGTTLMAQPIVGRDEEEYTIAAFCDGTGGYFASMALRRKLSRDGYTEKAEVVETAGFISTVAELCRLLRPLGPTNFQFRISDGLPKLLEINPRISSSTSIRTAFGYNESAMAVEYFLEHRTPIQPTIRRGRAVRYTEDHIVYEDGVYL